MHPDESLGVMEQTADHHEQQRHVVDALATELVAELAEEELPHERAAERDAVHGRDDVAG